MPCRIPTLIWNSYGLPNSWLGWLRCSTWVNLASTRAWTTSMAFSRPVRGPSRVRTRPYCQRSLTGHLFSVGCWRKDSLRDVGWIRDLLRGNELRGAKGLLQSSRNCRGFCHSQGQHQVFRWQKSAMTCRISLTGNLSRGFWQLFGDPLASRVLRH